MAGRVDLASAFSVGARYFELGRLDDAEVALRSAVAHDPTHGRSWYLLGVIKIGKHDYESALELLQRAAACDPNSGETQNDLGVMLQIHGRRDEAAICYKRAVALMPNHAEAHFNLGCAMYDLGRWDEAIACYRRAIALRPNYEKAHNNLGSVLQDQGKLDESVASYRRALAIRPDYAEALNNLGGALKAQWKLEEAEASCRRALAIRPDYAEAYNNLAILQEAQGKLGEAVANYRHALAIQPNFAAAHTSLIFALNFDLASSPEQQAQERARWYEQHGRRFAAAIPCHANRPEPERRLRVGYVSAHFRRQAATYAFASVLLNHDAEHFEVVCYSDTVHPDDVTQAFQARIELWRDTRGWPDDRLAAAIRADGIDILVDLSGHMSGNRLLVFARKPAPIQVTGWGEPTGTGLLTMDYLLADPVLVPSKQRGLLVEQVVDLPGFLGYWTPDVLPDPGPLPALANGYVTFGSFNRLTKVSDTVLLCWAAILRASPNSRLVLKDYLLVESNQQARVRAVLSAQGIAPERLTLLGGSDRRAHFAAYRMLDIALDPFPHGGGMTTLDALWMGVPVVTAPGPTISSRLAAASLTALGLTELIASDRDALITLAAEKAAQLRALLRLRQELRGRVAASAIGDPARYAGAVEAAYRVMWHRWCAASNKRPS
jgi:predicted O-linked N-acetylglucosamine transferase (SPINDLY family)